MASAFCCRYELLVVLVVLLCFGLALDLVVVEIGKTESVVVDVDTGGVATDGVVASVEGVVDAEVAGVVSAVETEIKRGVFSPISASLDAVDEEIMAAINKGLVFY